MNKFNSQIADMRHTIIGLEEENDKLRSTMRDMVEDYTKQLELRDENLRRMEMNQPARRSDSQQELDEVLTENRNLKMKL